MSNVVSIVEARYGIKVWDVPASRFPLSEQCMEALNRIRASMVDEPIKRRMES